MPYAIQGLTPIYAMADFRDATAFPCSASAAWRLRKGSIRTLSSKLLKRENLPVFWPHFANSVEKPA